LLLFLWTNHHDAKQRLSSPALPSRSEIIPQGRRNRLTSSPEIRGIPAQMQWHQVARSRIYPGIVKSDHLHKIQVASITPPLYRPVREVPPFEVRLSILIRPRQRSPPLNDVVFKQHRPPLTLPPSDSQQSAGYSPSRTDPQQTTTRPSFRRPLEKDDSPHRATFLRPSLPRDKLAAVRPSRRSGHETLSCSTGWHTSDDLMRMYLDRRHRHRRRPG
jgi:hypothetical protein